MKKIMIILLSASALLLSGCRIFYVIQPISTTNGSIIDIEVQVKAAVSRRDTPVFCIAVPDTWNVLSASYVLTTDGAAFIPGDGTFNQDDSDFMNANHAGIDYVWRCYRGPLESFNNNAYGSMYFEVEVLSSGTYTLRYSAGSVDDETAYSMVDKKIFVDDAVDCFDNWQQIETGTTSPLEGITYGSGKYVAVGWNGTILTSPDVTTWTQETSGTINPLYGITYGNGKYVAIGYSGTILTSSDGIAWTQETSGIPDSLHGITYGSGKYVAVGGSGTILTSPDGTTWTKETSGTTGYLQSITYGYSKYVAVGHSGEILTSPDATTWTKETSGTIDPLYGLTYGNSKFLAVGENGEVLTSPDGTTWTQRTSGTGFTFFGVIPGNNNFYAVGITPTFAGLNAGIFVRSMCNTYNLEVTNAGTGGGAVTTSPAGIDCGTDCTEDYDMNTTVDLAAVPSGNSTFSGWSGHADCNDSQVIMDTDKTCTATFECPGCFYNLTLTQKGTGDGTVTSTPAGIDCGVDCTENVSSNTEVTLTATPADPDFIFIGWSGDADCYDGAVIMDMDKNCTATFDSCVFLVKRTGSVTAYSDFLHESYSGASDLDIIYTQDTLLTEDVDFNRPISVTVEGGYNCDYTEITGTTTISGNMNVSDGSVLLLKGTVQLQ